jgi:hypothetical protein
MRAICIIIAGSLQGNADDTDSRSPFARPACRWFSNTDVGRAHRAGRAHAGGADWRWRLRCRVCRSAGRPGGAVLLAGFAALHKIRIDFWAFIAIIPVPLTEEFAWKERIRITIN